MKTRKKAAVALAVAVVCSLVWGSAVMASGSHHRGGGQEKASKYVTDNGDRDGWGSNSGFKSGWSGFWSKNKDWKNKDWKSKDWKNKDGKSYEWTLTPEVSIVADLNPAAAAGMRIEGLTGDRKGQLYTIDMDSRTLYRVTPKTGDIKALTVLPRVATGMAFDKAGNLYMASGGSDTQEGVILKVPADALKGDSFPADRVSVFATGTNGANGLAFDHKGILYVSGGATGNIYRIKPDGTKTVWASGFAADRSAQPIVVNGLAFGRDGKLYIANTSSGSIHRVVVNKDGTFGESGVYAKDAKLYGADGIAFGPDGKLYVAANERNAIVKVTADGVATDVVSNGNSGPLEFPASLHFVGKKLYASNFDVERGTNSPNAPGIGASIAEIVFVKAKKA